ncbi:hypothetical protein [Streptomyces tirandamycinicus]|uniref:Uncharacterized protein n=1 Tax=Streptomyces tirandamycinicus TaxID=2174846 RepID=A0A2S1T1Y8_9ACTN|nr:hypothetical protein [Streptomyces tirandamycinicus]AWI32679.1 hypothetical protein DDW44_30655 [Streptomyces tirandamycinicus]
MDWLTSAAPIVAPIFGSLGVIVGAFFSYRQVKRRGDADENVAAVQAKAAAEAAEGQTYVEAMKTVTAGFSSLLDQQRGMLDQQRVLLDQERTMHAQTVQRVAMLEAGQLELTREVRELQEEQRKDRRWKAAALDYIRDLRGLVVKALGRSAPEPPEEIAADIASLDR